MLASQAVYQSFRIGSYELYRLLHRAMCHIKLYGLIFNRVYIIYQMNQVNPVSLPSTNISVFCQAIICVVLVASKSKSPSLKRNPNKSTSEHTYDTITIR